MLQRGLLQYTINKYVQLGFICLFLLFIQGKFPPEMYKIVKLEGGSLISKSTQNLYKEDP